MSHQNLRTQITIQGAVQGVGFRPFIYRLATELELTGWISNTPAGVTIEVEGLKSRLDLFHKRILRENPPHSVIQKISKVALEPAGYTHFTIGSSNTGGEKLSLLLPDLATCDDCLKELFDPANRRYMYPFINCTQCGPRYSIIETLPYDRPNTTMKQFVMCEECRREYTNPHDRRFHAQPNACQVCGPHVELWNTKGTCISSRSDAIRRTCQEILNGNIVAIKGLGGFHLAADARNEKAVSRLRKKKNREEKPFALMFPSLFSIDPICTVSELERTLLLSAESPIVLLERNTDIPCTIADNVAPRNPYFGVMLPYTPLHHILMRELNIPIIATSGNRSDEPLCFDEHEALTRLGEIADFLLVHNRPIVRPVDDSILRLMSGREQIVRRARGYAPLPIDRGKPLPTVLATGGHLKNTIAMSRGTNIFISQHIGDLETSQAYEVFQEVIKQFQTVYHAVPEKITCDLHPDYLSTQYAQNMQQPVVPVQHHYAHVLSCMAEHQHDAPVLGVAWDGTGFGTDGTIWGGEFLTCTLQGFQRVAHLLPFPLLTGEHAIQHPCRTALGLLFTCLGEKAFTLDLPCIHALPKKDVAVWKDLLQKNIQCPRTTSMGRLFDAVSSILDLCQHMSFEGQAAMELEYALHGCQTDTQYPFDLLEDDPIVIDWRPVVHAILDDLNQGTPIPFCSARFHNSCVEMVITIARLMNQRHVVLTGGCFQNRYLSEQTVQRLSKEGFQPYWHRLIPPNDGGISLGQIVYACNHREGLSCA